MSLESILGTVSKQGGLTRCELGKIKIGGLGEKRPTRDGKSTWRLPRKDDFFTVTGVARNKEGDLVPDNALMAELIKDHGDPDGKLRQMPIRLLSDDIDKVLQARFCWYGKRSCGAWSDGERVTWKYDPQTMQPINPPRVEDWRPEMADMTDKAGNVLFKLHASFSCTIHSRAGRWGGVYLFRTTSVISFRQLYASLLEISDKTGGILVGMPLFLVVRPMLVTPDGKPTNVYVCHTELRGKDLQELQRLAVAQSEFRVTFKSNLMDIERRYQRLLVAPGEEPDEEASEIAEEFAPSEQTCDEAQYAKADFAAQSSVVSTTQQLTDLLAGDVGQRVPGEVAQEQPPQQEPTTAQAMPEPPTDEDVSIAATELAAATEAPSVAHFATETEPDVECEPSAQDAAWSKLMGDIEAATDFAVAKAAADAYMGVWGVTDDEHAAIDRKLAEDEARINAPPQDQRSLDWTATLDAIRGAMTHEAITAFAAAFKDSHGLKPEEAKILNATVRTAWAMIPATPPTAGDPTTAPKPKTQRRGPGPSPQQQLPGV
jgi:hypothetical protein